MVYTVGNTEVSSQCENLFGGIHMLNHKKTSEIIEEMLHEGVFKNLTLTPEGDLFADPILAAKADWFWIYYQGAFYGQQGGRFECFGEKAEETVTFQVLADQMAAFPVENAGYFLRSLEPVIDKDQTFFSVLQYRGVLALVIAVGAISRGVYLTIMEESEEDEVLMKNNFIALLRRCDPKLLNAISDLS
jgi:hypothetical protein